MPSRVWAGPSRPPGRPNSCGPPCPHGVVWANIGVGAPRGHDSGRARRGRYGLEDRYEMTTARLRLYAPSLAEVSALLRGERAAVGARIGAALPDEWWRGPSLIRLLPHLREDMTRALGDARW